MKITHILFGLLCLVGMVTLTSCGDDEGVGNLEVQFDLKFGDQPFETLKAYDYVDGQKVSFTRVSFFLSDFALSGLGDPIDPISYHRLENEFAPGAAGSYKYTINNIPNGDYDGFSLGFGVTAENNAKTPADFASGHPLSATGEYWNTWQSYVFVKLEGTLTLGDGTEKGFTLHIGGDETYRVFTSDRAVDIKTDDTTTLPLTIDLQNVFLERDTPYNLEENGRLHSLAAKPFMIELIDNMMESIN